MAIITAHPRPGKRARVDGNEHERLAAAREALLGTSERSQKTSRQDDKILLTLAKHVFSEVFHDRAKNVDLASIIRRLAVGVYPEGELKRAIDGESATVRRLRDRFAQHSDDYLTRATMDNDEGRRQILQTICEIADRLEKLNVKVDRDTLSLGPTRKG
jgi:hypothetical protein